MSSFGFSANTNSAVSNETRNLTIKGRQTIPLGLISQTPVQRGGSLIFDPRTLKLFYSDGTQWLAVVASPGGNLVCIQDTDGDTSVCTDTIPETDSDTIFFNTAGTEKARISSTGVFMVGTTTPTPGKIAHFEVDIDVTGIVDPIGVQYSQQATPPGSTNVPDKGMLYTDSASLGTFSNTLVFVDNTDVPHTLGDLISTAGPVTDNTIARFDGTTGKLLKDSSIILDTGVLSRPTGDIGLIPDSGDGFVTVTGSVNISKDLNVFGTTTTSQSQHLLIGDNCIYLNDGYITPAALAGCIVVNYLPTANSAGVAVGGFTEGNGGASTVVTDNTNAWIAGDIIQISGASNAANDGLFEVDSYVNPLLTIRGVGGNPLTFNFFQNQFETDSTVLGTITQVGVAVISSGSDGIWETNNAGNNTGGMVFTDIGTLATSGTGTFSLVFDAGTRTLKELTSGMNITIVDSGTGNLTISAIGGAVSPWQQIGSRIEPITASTNGLLCGITSGVGTNSFVSTVTNSTIVGGTLNTILRDGFSTNTRDGIFVGTGNTIRTLQGNGGPSSSDNVILGGRDNTITNTRGCLISSSDTCMVDTTIDRTGVSFSSVMSSTSCNLSGSAQMIVRDCSILAARNSEINGESFSTTEYCAVIASNSCTIQTLQGNSNPTHRAGTIISSESCTLTNVHQGSIIASNNCQLASASDRNHIFECAIIACENCNMPSGTTQQKCVILGGTGSVINGDSLNSTVIGSNTTCSHDGCFLFSDDQGGTDLVSGGDNRFRVRCAGGANFFSTTTNLVGVSLAVGGTSWAVVSDRDLKENIVECDYSDFLSKVDNLPVYCYNYIGNPQEQRCFGPVAQDWYSQFPVEKINVEEPDPEDPEGPPIIVEKDAKDIKAIEMMDMVGVCLSAIKGLISKNNQLEARISALES